MNIDGEIRHVGHNADVSVFSFQSVKNLPTADSGMICFKNEDYDTLVRKLSWLGIDKDTRNGKTRSVFGKQIRHKMKDGFPLLTTKKMYWKGIVTELM